MVPVFNLITKDSSVRSNRQKLSINSSNLVDDSRMNELSSPMKLQTKIMKALRPWSSTKTRNPQRINS